MLSFYIEENNQIAKSIDPLNNILHQKLDSRGNIVSVRKLDANENALTSATYKYNELSEMVQALDSENHSINIEYDLLGRRIVLESLDSGRQEFFYDECSNLIRENNSVLKEKNKQINYEYDGLNRLTKINYPDTEDTVYFYGKANDTNGASNKIKKIEDSSGAKIYEYGKLGEVIKEVSKIKTHLNKECKEENAVMEYKSDYLGRMQWIKYPDDEKITYVYDTGGQVISVLGEHFGNTFCYVKNILYDEYGNRLRIDYGNGSFTEYNYNPERRWLTSIKTENHFGKTLNCIDTPLGS